MSSDLDILEMFEKNLTKEIPVNREPKDNKGYKYDVCQMTWSVPGLFTGKFVPDSFNRPFRTIKYVKEVKYQISDKETGETISKFIRVAPIEDFKIQLNKEQIDIYNEVLKLIEMYEEQVGYGDKDRFVKTRNTMVIFYMALQAFINPEDSKSDPEEYIPSKLTTMIHTSANFTKAFQSQINEKTSKMRMFGKDKTWIIDYIKRDPGEYNTFVSITTTKPEGSIGYTVNFDFFESPNKVTITQEMLDEHPDLDSEIINSKVFDTDYWTKIRNELREVMDTKGVKITSAE